MSSDYPQSPDQKDSWSLITTERVGQPDLRSFLTRRPQVSEVIEWLKKQKPDVRGICQIEILQVANTVATEGMETMSQVWDYIKSDDAWKKVKVSGAYIKDLDQEFHELAALSDVGKKFRNRKGQMWRSIINMFPDLEHNQLIVNTCTSQNALQSLNQLCLRIHGQGLSSNVVRQQISLAFIYRLRRIGTASNRGHSKVNLITTEDYKTANTQPWGTSVPQLLTLEEMNKYNVQMVERLYAPTNSTTGLARDAAPAAPTEAPFPEGGSRLTIDIPPLPRRDSSAAASPPTISRAQGTFTPRDIQETLERLSDQMRKADIGTQSGGLPRSSSLSILPSSKDSRQSGSGIYSPQSGGTGTSGPPSPSPAPAPVLNVTTCGNTTNPCKNVTQQLIREVDTNRQATNSQGRVAMLQAFRRGLLKWPNPKSPNVCYRHARKFGGDIGLKVNQGDTWAILNKILYCVNHSDTEQMFENFQRTQQAWLWWRANCRTEVPADVLGLNKYFPTMQKYAPETFFSLPGGRTGHNFIAITKALGCLQDFAKTELDAKGTFTSTGTLQAHLEQSRLLYLFRVEFDMYCWHLRPQNVEMGWQRNQFYSLAQQAIRQDLGYYLLNVICRPDNKMWLVTSPYYVKYQHPGESVYFRHLDFNLQDLADYGRGQNQWQGTLSLDDEDENNCTIMCTGMNSIDKLKTWANRIVARKGELSTSFVTAVTDSDLTKDDLKVLKASWTPQPCTAGAIRISSPLLPHGTNKGAATKKRRTVFNWYVGLLEDHQFAEVAAGPTFDEISAAHRNMTVPPKTPSGFAYQFGYPKAGFPALVTLNGIGPIEDCLVARRKYSDYEVVSEMHKLLGQEFEKEDRVKAIERYIADSRKKVVDKLYGRNGEVSLWSKMVEQEMRAYGKNSFFYNHPQFRNAESITARNHDDVHHELAGPAMPGIDLRDRGRVTADQAMANRRAELDGQRARDTPDLIAQNVTYPTNPQVRPVTEGPAGNTRSQRSSGRGGGR